MPHLPYNTGWKAFQQVEHIRCRLFPWRRYLFSLLLYVPFDTGWDTFWQVLSSLVGIILMLMWKIRFWLKGCYSFLTNGSTLFDNGYAVCHLVFDQGTNFTMGVIDTTILPRLSSSNCFPNHSQFCNFAKWKVNHKGGYVLNLEINDNEPHNHTSSTPPHSQVKKCTKKCNCFGNSCGQGQRFNFNYIIRPDQAVHPILPAHTRRSGKQKQYSCRRVHCNSTLLDSAASIPLMFNMDQNQEQYSCNLKQKYLLAWPEVGESTKPNLTNEMKCKDTKQICMTKWLGTKYKQDVTNKSYELLMPEDKSYELLMPYIYIWSCDNTHKMLLEKSIIIKVQRTIFQIHTPQEMEKWQTQVQNIHTPQEMQKWRTQVQNWMNPVTCLVVNPIPIVKLIWMNQMNPVKMNWTNWATNQLMTGMNFLIPHLQTRFVTGMEFQIPSLQFMMGMKFPIPYL